MKSQEANTENVVDYLRHCASSYAVKPQSKIGTVPAVTDSNHDIKIGIAPEVTVSNKDIKTGTVPEVTE